MKNSMWSVCMLVFAAACGVSRPDHGDDSRAVVTDDSPVSTTAISTGSTPEDPALSIAAATGDPEIMARAAAAISAVCHGRVTCRDPKSCGPWSSPTACGSRICASLCGTSCSPDDPFCETAIDSTQATEIFRVCSILEPDPTLDGLDSLIECVEWAPSATITRCDDPMCAVPE